MFLDQGSAEASAPYKMGRGEKKRSFLHLRLRNLVFYLSMIKTNTFLAKRANDGSLLEGKQRGLASPQLQTLPQGTQEHVTASSAVVWLAAVPAAGARRLSAGPN